MSGAWLLSLSGCQAEMMLRSDRYILLWVLAPFLLVLIGGLLYVRARRLRDLAEWDLASSPGDPDRAPIAITLSWISGILVVLFATVNFLISSMALTQRLVNTGAWIVGTALGGVVAYFLGLSLADPPRAAEPLDPKKLPTGDRRS